MLYKFCARLRSCRFAGIHFRNLVLNKNMVPMKSAALKQFSSYGSPGQTTMTMSRAAKFCTRSRSQSLNIFDLDLISFVILGMMEPWPECQPN